MAQTGFCRFVSQLVPIGRRAAPRLQSSLMIGMGHGSVFYQGRSMSSKAKPALAIGGNNPSGGGRGGVGGGKNGGGGGPGDGPSNGGTNWGSASALGLASGMLLFAESAWAAAKKPDPAPSNLPVPPGELTVEKVTDLLLSLAGPILTNLGFSGCVGAAAGIALKKVGVFLATCVGLIFLMLQGLATTGFITVNWTHVHRTVNSVLDVNKDGVVNTDDFRPFVSQLLAGLSQGVPSVGGFLAGFIMAIRYV